MACMADNITLIHYCYINNFVGLEDRIYPVTGMILTYQKKENIGLMDVMKVCQLFHVHVCACVHAEPCMLHKSIL